MGHRDCVLPLDETADGEKEMPLDKRARAMAFGIARNRLRRFASTHERAHGLKGREYRVIVLSSSERALTEIAIRPGRPAWAVKRFASSMFLRASLAPKACLMEKSKRTASARF